jgi:hypothetical protein
VPPALDAIVMKALAKEPAARWQTAGELAAALEDVVVTLGFGGEALAAQMKTLFAADAEAFHAARELTLAEHDTEPMPRVEPAAVAAAAGETLSPHGATLASLRRRPPRWRVWRYLLAAALASLAGGWVGWVR